ncbi:MAG: DctP family TRAP transporter solute-binding subunit [Sphaerochaetaceae bacterium]|nr:DctP family TRAP transporter solute-binding subunit [Sphaerochaetaceae bacterium]
MKRNLWLCCIIALMCGTFAMSCSKEASKTETSASEPRTVIAAHTGNERTTYQVGMEAFKREVERLSEGRFKVDIYPSTLGGDKELMESLQIGTVDFAEVNTSVLASIVPELGIFDLPYLFISREHAYEVFDGEVGDTLLGKVRDKAGITPIAYWENGFRCFTNNVRPITKPEDLKALKMRSMQSNIHLTAYRLWGADPTPMSISEMVTAMQQGVIQGHDNNIDTVVANSMWEYQKYFTESWHFYGSKVLAFSNQFWNSLSDEDKVVFTQAVETARDVERAECASRYGVSLETLSKNGMQITHKDEVLTEAFVESVQPVWDSYVKQYGDALIQKINALK